MQGLKSLQQLEGHFPDEGLVEALPIVVLETVVDLSFQIPSISVLHHQAEGLVVAVEERALVADDIGDADGGEEADFVESTFLLLLVETSH